MARAKARQGEEGRADGRSRANAGEASEVPEDLETPS